MPTLDELLKATAAMHHHLCPRQVLGVRMALYGGRLLELEFPRDDKGVIALVETDGCATDGIAVTSGCRVGRRTLRVMDLGKVAVTFVEVATRRAVRIAPRTGIREAAAEYAPQAATRWQAQLLGYQRMPDEELFLAQEVTLLFSLAKMLGRDGYRVNCHVCGEEIINEREVVVGGRVCCRTCAGERYYSVNAVDAEPEPVPHAGYRITPDALAEPRVLRIA